jgi:hypothetical protein
VLDTRSFCPMARLVPVIRIGTPVIAVPLGAGMTLGMLESWPHATETVKKSSATRERTAVSKSLFIGYLSMEALWLSPG